MIEMDCLKCLIQIRPSRHSFLIFVSRSHQRSAPKCSSKTLVSFCNLETFLQSPFTIFMVLMFNDFQEFITDIY